MHLHANAKLTPVLRRLLVERVRVLRWRVTEAAAAVGVSRQTAYKWLARYDAEGEGGLADRSSRPHRLRRKTPRRLVERMVRLRRRRKPAWEIASATGVPTSTVSRHLQAEGLGRLWRLEEAENPPQHSRPGEARRMSPESRSSGPLPRRKGGVSSKGLSYQRGKWNPPSERFRRQVMVTFEEEPLGAQLIPMVGADSCMWASHYPHTDSTFCARLYGFEPAD